MNRIIAFVRRLFNNKKADRYLDRLNRRAGQERHHNRF